MARRKAKAEAVADVPMPMDHHESVNIRKISNGFLVRHTKSGPDGYKETETYHPKMPPGLTKGPSAFNPKDVERAEGPKRRMPRET